MLATTATEPRRVKLARRSSTMGGDMALSTEESGRDDSSAMDATAAATQSVAGWADVTPSRNASRLVPIIPPHEIMPGAMDVDMDRSRLGTLYAVCFCLFISHEYESRSSFPWFSRRRVSLMAGACNYTTNHLHAWNCVCLYLYGHAVYLAPLTSVKKEIYRDKHNPHVSTSPERNTLTDDAVGVDPRSPRKKLGSRSPAKHIILASLGRSKLTANSDRAHASKMDNPMVANQHVQTISSVTGSPESQQQNPLQSSNKQNGSPEREEDDQIARLKQKVRLLPISDSDRLDFWESIRKYQKLQMQYHRSMLHNQSTPMGFNMEAAWCKTVRQRTCCRCWVA